MGVKAILIGTLVALTLFQSLLTFGNIQDRREQLANADLLIGRVDQARALVHAVQALALERGRTNAVLRSMGERADRLPELRENADQRMATVLDLTGENEGKALLGIMWNKFLERRSIVDRTLAERIPDPELNKIVADSWMSLANGMVGALDQALRQSWNIDEEVSRQGRNLWVLVTTAARMRVAAGQDAARLSGDMIDGMDLTPEDLVAYSESRGAIREIWRDLRQAAAPFRNVNDRIQTIDARYWKSFIPEREQLLRGATDPSAPRPSTEAFIAAVLPALRAITELAFLAGDQLVAHAGEQVAEAKRSLAVECGLLALYLLLSVSAISLLHFRVSRPLAEMAEKLSRVQGRTAASTTRDEVKRLAAMVDDYSQTLKDLRTSEELFRLSTKAAKDGIWDWDFRTGEIWFSPRWKEQLGYEDHELENNLQAWESVIFPEDREIALRLAEDYNSGRVAQFDVIQRFRHKDGHTVHIHSRAIHERDETGAIVRMVGAHTDITDRVEHESELTAAWEKAEDANRAKSNFLAVISHELRTPLTGILGMADMLLASRLGKRQEHWVGVLRSSGTALLHLVNDILDYSKIEAGRMTLETVNHDPVALAEDVVESLRHQARTKGLDLTLDAEAIGMRAGDPTKLRQILTNLVGNALKFTENGRVNLRIRSADSMAEDGIPAPVYFEVWDTGIGMTEAQLSKLFTPFTQADDSTTRRYGGTGLGLVICQRLCLAMGGEISCHSVPGEGSRFTFTLPLGSPSSEHPTLETKSTDSFASFGAMPALRILVAEDNETNRLLLSEVLEGQGHEVTLVNDGRAAVEAARRGLFDAVLMDMQMPVMDGLDATRHIRQLDPGQGRDHLPILALTANVNAEESLGDEAGLFDAFLTKPIDWSMLAATLAATTSRENGEEAPRPEEAPLSATGRARLPDGSDHASAHETEDWWTHPVFDHFWIDALPAHVAGERIAVILRSLEGRLTQPLEALRVSLDAEDMESAGRVGHALRGLSSQFGLRRVHCLADKVESLSDRKDAEGVEALFPILEAEIDKAVKAIAEKLKMVAVA